ncbi:MAG: hypothetical protein EBU31_02715 [Proteobacteria bacterium]|nr:hypothetical protein [Pseudomonadota bacterium]
MNVPSSIALPLALSAALGASLPPMQARAAIVLDEATTGDFSDDRLAPTAVTLGTGMNVIAGFSGQSPVPDMHDLDYVRFTVPVGHVLTRFLVQDAFVGGAFSFVGMQAGPEVTIPWTWSNVNSPLLGWSHFGSADIGSDLFPTMARSPGSVGFTPPLGAGTYTLWIMELDISQVSSYRFGLEVAPIPGPSAAWLAAVLARRPRRRPA